MHILRRISTPGIDTKAQQENTAYDLQVELVLLVIDKVHDKRHTESRNSGIENIAYGGTDTCHQPVPAALLQRTMHAEHTYWSHRSRCYHAYQHPLEHQVHNIYMYRKRHIVCKGTN